MEDGKDKAWAKRGGGGEGARIKPRRRQTSRSDRGCDKNNGNNYQGSNTCRDRALCWELDEIYVL